jgi:hypothetical protein
MIFNIVAALITFVVFTIILRAWVLVVLWGWFLVPLGAFELSIATAIGISIIVGLFTQHLQKDYVEVKYKTGMVDGLLGLLPAVIAPLVALLTGWIVTWFM